MILHLSRMRRNINRNVYDNRKNVSATAALAHISGSAKLIGRRHHPYTKVLISEQTWISYATEGSKRRMFQHSAIRIA